MAGPAFQEGQGARLGGDSGKHRPCLPTAAGQLACPGSPLQPQPRAWWMSPELTLDLEVLGLGRFCLGVLEASRCCLKVELTQLFRGSSSGSLWVPRPGPSQVASRQQRLVWKGQLVGQRVSPATALALGPARQWGATAGY